MADRTRSKTSQDSDEKLDSFKSALATMLAPALEEQRTFIENQFAKLDHKLEQFKADLVKNSNDIKLLKEENKGMNTTITRLSENCQSAWSKLEASIAEQEDRSRRDNIRIINLPENAETSNVRAHLLSVFPKWFPDLPADGVEVMRARRVGPERTSAGFPRTVICRMLRSTDRDRILKMARDTNIKADGREIRFAADYSNYTAKRRRAFASAMNTARKLGYTPFLIYPARLKLMRGAEIYFFNTHGDAEEFLKSGGNDQQHAG